MGVVFFIIAGQVNRKIGARMTSGICCIISGIAYILACNAPSIVIYTVCMCFVYGGIMSAGYVAGGTLVASWFPKRRAWLWAIPPWATTSPPLSMCSW